MNRTIGVTGQPCKGDCGRITFVSDGTCDACMTGTDWCERFKELDARFDTSPKSPLHHDNRCRQCNPKAQPLHRRLVATNG